MGVRRAATALTLGALLAAARPASASEKLVVPGAVTLGMSYLVGIPLALADPGEPHALRLVPIVGPVWGAACAFGGCGSVPASPAVGVGESVVAAGQIAGATLLVIGLLSGRRAEDAGATAGALQLGPSPTGLGVSGRF